MFEYKTHGPVLHVLCLVCSPEVDKKRIFISCVKTSVEKCKKCLNQLSVS